MARNNLIQFRKGTLSQFNSANPTLASGEPGFAIDANVLKVGDGITPWSGLLGFSVGSGISSLNGLTSSSLVIDGGHNIQITTSGSEVINVAYTGLEHLSIPAISDEINSNNTFIQNLLFDQYGHVTGVSSVAVTGVGSSVPSNVLVSGDNISLLTNDIGYDTIPTYILGASGSSHYLFSGPGLSPSTQDPTLYLVRGRTYKFVNNMGAHPFQFQTSAGIGGTAYTSGIDNSPITNATMTWEVRHDTPNILYYQCTSHSSMNGLVYVLDKDSHPDILSASNSNNNGDFFIQNLLFDQHGHVTGVFSSEAATGIVDAALNTQIQSGDNIVLVYDSGTGVDPTGTLTINVTGVVELGDNISFLTNDAGYATTGELVSVSGYLQGRIDSIPSDTNTFVSGIVYNTGLRDLVLTRNDGVQLTGNFDIVLHSGDNISLLTNDSAYDSIPEYTLTSPGLGSVNYRFNGPGLSGGVDDPTLYLYRGKTYKFVNNMGAHPFQFQTTAGLGGTAYTDGITGSPVSNGTLTWEIEHDTPNILYYQCTSHSNMQGAVYILDKDSHPAISTTSSVDNSNNTFVQDLLFDQYGHVTGVASVAVTGIPTVPNNVLVSGDNISLLTNDAGYATTGELSSVSGYLQGQINALPSDTNTFVNNIVYNTGNRDIVLSRNDGVALTGDLSVVLHSGDNISLLNNNLGYITGFTETISSGDPISFLINDVPYAISGTHIAITNAASNVNNTDDDFVQDLLFDEFGHITGVVSAKASSGVVNSALNTQVQAGEHILLIYDSGTGSDPTGTLTINVTGIIDGGATANYLPVFSNTVTPLVNSIIHQNGDRIGIGTTNPATAIHIVAPSGNEGTVLSRTLDHTSFAGHLIRDIDDRNVASFQYCNSGVAATGLRNHVLIGSRESGIPVKFYQGRDSGQTAFKENNERIIFDIYGNTILTAASGQNVMVSGSLDVSGIITATSGNSTQWNTAYGWGDHSQAAYLTGHPVISAANTSANSGNVFIQNLTLDSNGHITAIDVAIPTGAGGGGSGISSLLEDQNPQLGGNLSLNNKNINGAGNIDIDGDITAEELTISSSDPYIYQRSTDSTATVKTYHYDTGSQLGGLLSYGKSPSTFTSFNTLLGLGAGSFHLFSSYGHLGINTYGVAKDIVLGTDNTERVRITSSGNVGIGTSTPAYNLDVTGVGRFVHSDGVCGLLVEDTGGSGVHIGDCAYSDGDTYTGMKHSNHTHGQEYMIISAGHSTVVSSKAGTSTYIRAGGNATTYQGVFGTGSFGIGPNANRLRVNSQSVILNNGTGNYDFKVYGHNNATQLIHADAALHRVGIGTATPATKLDVNGVITATGGDSTTWNTGYSLAFQAYSWGDHSLAGYFSTDEQIEDIVGIMVSGNTETGITVTYDDNGTGNGKLNFAVATQSDNNFTTALLNKLNAIESGATADQTGSEIKSLYEAESNTNAFTDTLLGKLNGIESGADVTDATNVDDAGAVMNSDSSTSSMSFVIDEDDMASDSNSKIPTQQSVKAYVDNNSGGAGGSGNLVRGSEVVTATTGIFDVSEGYSVGTLDVYQNGVKLFEGASYDYTATNGTSFNLTNPATSGDLIEYLGLNTSTNAVGNTSLGTITVTSNQDVFNTVDTFTSSNLAVFLNGVKLIDGEDYDVTSTSQFTLDSVATSGDIVEYIAYGATVASSNLQKTGDTMTGNLTVNADLIVKGYKETHTDNGNTGIAQTIDISDSTLQTYTLTGNCTFTMPTADAGRSFTMFLKTGAGSFTSTFTGVKFPSNVAPTITTDANRMDILTFYSDGTNWYGSTQQEYHV